MAPLFSDSPHQWFEDRYVDVSLFRINRREIDPEQAAILPRFSEDLLTHVKAALGLAGPIAPRRSAGTVSTQHEGREWNIGNVEEHAGDDENYLTGRIGVVSKERIMHSEFDHESKTWSDVPVDLPRSFTTGVVILGTSRLVGIAAVPGITANAFARVLARALNDGERKLTHPVTDWHVDPVFDEIDFWSWVDSASRITEVRTIFARPNPDGAEAWQDDMDRLDALEAENITEIVKARDKESGLNKSALKHDAELASKVAAAKRSWASIFAKGEVDNRVVNYSQEKSVASERIAEKSDSWFAFMAGLVDATFRGRRKMR